MDGLRIANQLLAALDRLMSQVADEPVLLAGLSRERHRLVSVLERTLECQLASCLVPRRQEGATPKRAKSVMGAGRIGLRLSCYRALALGLLPSQRFDALMLLSRRARRHRAQSAASSETLMSSSPESSTLGSVGCGSSGVGSPLRMNLSSTSTICA